MQTVAAEPLAWLQCRAPSSRAADAAVTLLQSLPYTQNSAHWFARVRDLGMPVWLDSARPYSTRGRYDIISAAPLATIIDNGEDNIFAKLREALRALKPRAIANDLPFNGGVIALLGYEPGRRLHRLAARAKALPFPDAVAGVYSWAIIVDHELQRTTLVTQPETPASLQRDLAMRLKHDFAVTPGSFVLTEAWREDFPAANYRQAFTRLQEYIRAGDCYQVNLARRFHANFSGDPFHAYLHLRQIAAAPFSAYFEYQNGAGDSSAALSFSPERFLAARDRQLLTQPIKGTAPRARNPQRDRELAEQLRNSEKNRAENLMIVDLLRNDLGRSCKPGSIRVEQLFELQSFAAVHHLVSSIRGDLRDDTDALEALEKCFPGGSITGAPKYRAMQIIDELEPNARSIFCGAIGYIDSSGNMDTNITIRTLLACRQKIYAWAGGGIVADSNCDEELKETSDKIHALLQALTTIT